MIKLPFPVPTNALYRKPVGSDGKRYGKIKTKRYNAWLDEAGWRIVQQRPFQPTEGAYRLDITLQRPDKRKRDLDNLVKAISDLLVKQGVTPDDSEMVSLTVRWSDAPVGGPTVYVTAG